MAVTLGTNAGFVTTAPTGSPAVGATSVKNQALVIKDTSPVDIIRISEIGWYVVNATDEDNFEVGLYSDDGTGEPNLLLEVSRTNAKGTTTGWKRVTGLNISISPETIYWVAAQLDNTSPTTYTNIRNIGITSHKYKFGATTLSDPYGANSNSNWIVSIYALVEVEAGVTRKIKIAGTFQDKPIKTKVGGTFVDKPIKIKVGGTFQDA